MNNRHTIGEYNYVNEKKHNGFDEGLYFLWDALRHKNKKNRKPNELYKNIQ